jgi:tetratricopeptide (TPR) repeat protein
VLLLWWKRGRLGVRDALALAPFFALGLALGLFTAWLEKHHVGAAGADWDLSAAQRVLIAGRALWFYAGKLAWPMDLTFIYPRWAVNASSGWQYLFPAAALAVMAGLWLARGRLGKGPLVAVLFFAGTLLPALGFIDVYPMRYSFVADHFQYLASAGLIALAGPVGVMLVRRANLGRAAQGLAVAVPVLVLGVLTWQQQAAYADLQTLWTDTLKKNPDCWMAWNSLGALALEEANLPEAEKCLTEALRLRPDHAKAHYNLGRLRVRQKRLDEAVGCYQEALRIDPQQPPVHNELGRVCGMLGRLDEARLHFSRAIEIQPYYWPGHLNLGLLLAHLGEYSAAVEHLAEAARLNPGNAEIVRRLDQVRSKLPPVPRRNSGRPDAAPR